MAKIAFDIDGTLLVTNQKMGRTEPDQELLAALKWFYKNGDEVFLWSSGGVEYAKEIAEKLGITAMVKIIEKPDFGGHHPDMDLAFDDVEKNLAKTNILIRREK